MITKTLLIAMLALVGTATVHADEVTPSPAHVYASTLSRAEVREATIQWLMSGAQAGGDRSVFIEPTGVAKTRAQVHAETLEAQRLGVIGHGERSVVISDAQLDLIRLAGLKALPMNVAAR